MNKVMLETRCHATARTKNRSKKINLSIMYD